MGFTFRRSTAGITASIDSATMRSARTSNLIQQGRKYGWPYVFGYGQLNFYRDPPAGKGTIEQWDKDSVRSVLTYTAHSSGIQMVFLAGDTLPLGYKGDILATLHGSLNRQPPSGFEIVRVHLRLDHHKA